MNKIIIHNYTDLSNDMVMHLVSGITTMNEFPTKNGVVIEYTVSGKRVIVDYTPRNYGVRVNVIYANKVEG